MQHCDETEVGDWLIVLDPLDLGLFFGSCLRETSGRCTSPDVTTIFHAWMKCGFVKGYDTLWCD